MRRWIDLPLDPRKSSQRPISVLLLNAFWSHSYDRCCAEVEGLGDVMKQLCVYIYITIYTRVEACVHMYMYTY